MVRETEGKLVEDHLEFLQGECRTMVKDGKYEGKIFRGDVVIKFNFFGLLDLSRMYQLLKPIPEGLKVILTELESHIQETGKGSLLSTHTASTSFSPGLGMIRAVPSEKVNHIKDIYFMYVFISILESC